jgi:hypothetical protein
MFYIIRRSAEYLTSLPEGVGRPLLNVLSLLALFCLLSTLAAFVYAQVCGPSNQLSWMSGKVRDYRRGYRNSVRTRRELLSSTSWATSSASAIRLHRPRL